VRLVSVKVEESRVHDESTTTVIDGSTTNSSLVTTGVYLSRHLHIFFISCIFLVIGLLAARTTIAAGGS